MKTKKKSKIFHSRIIHTTYPSPNQNVLHANDFASIIIPYSPVSSDI